MVRELQPWTKTVIDEHNVESELVASIERIANPALRPLLRWQATRVHRLERQLVSQADVVMACSADDARRLEWLGARRTVVIPNGVALPSVVSPSHSELRRRNSVVFVGSFDWAPNVDAAIRLARGIWPSMKQSVAPSNLVLVGRKPGASVRALGGRNVLVTGTVPSVEPFLRDAWATAVPLRAGSGTRLKLLEAAAAGVPIVASALGAEGLGLRDGTDYLRAETDADFRNALTLLFRDRERAGALQQSALEVARRFAWDQIGDRVKDAYAAGEDRARE
jgi:glycosyltransferase involved in cell wall biosynthesis